MGAFMNRSPQMQETEQNNEEIYVGTYINSQINMRKYRKSGLALRLDKDILWRAKLN